jgi:hypothetical protein
MKDIKTIFSNVFTFQNVDEYHIVSGLSVTVKFSLWKPLMILYSEVYILNVQWYLLHIIVLVPTRSSYF